MANTGKVKADKETETVKFPVTGVPHIDSITQDYREYVRRAWEHVEEALGMHEYTDWYAKLDKWRNDEKIHNS